MEEQRKFVIDIDGLDEKDIKKVQNFIYRIKAMKNAL